ncbi:hypothetical protein GCM10009422_24060 [Brevundimonas kwangchunensis]|uniref:Uncharacterized protein n=1 Tax=Brevundimonas kwangchunensis TaxID=322163 RepID=A0ABN1H1J2_9CAUL
MRKARSISRFRMAAATTISAMAIAPGTTRLASEAPFILKGEINGIAAMVAALTTAMARSPSQYPPRRVLGSARSGVGTPAGAVTRRPKLTTTSR